MAVAFQVDEELGHNNDDDDGEPRWVNWLGECATGGWSRGQTDRQTVVATPVGVTVVVVVVALVVVNLPLSSAQPSHLR